MSDFIKNILTYSPEAPMMFSQLFFWVFLALVLLVYSLVYKEKTLRISYLFLISLFFYYKTGGYFFTLLIFSTIVDYILGLSIHKQNSKALKKLFLILSILVNLGVLSYFKYAYFFVDLFNQIFETQYRVVNVLALWGNHLTNGGFNISEIILPVGISFYTFQTISYTVDVYRNKVNPVRSIIDFGFYVSFFPQLVAGPIVRAASFIPQLYQKYSLTVQEMGYAIFLILSGLIKKMLISDYISMNFVDRVFESPHLYTGFENLLSLYGYSIQIYCDFSGYTDIAIGVGLLLGFKLPINFNSPYKAISLSDFWRRWHISLSLWLKDYLYISLGGNRKGKFRTYANLIITMLIGGLWHGANMRFVIWGALHGIVLVIEKIWKQINPFTFTSSVFSRFISGLFTFHFVTFAWLFFRAKDMHIVKSMLNQIAYNFKFSFVFETFYNYRISLVLILFGFSIHWLPNRFKENYRGWFIRTPMVFKAVIVTLVVFVLYQFKSSDLQPFIYFQF